MTSGLTVGKDRTADLLRAIASLAAKTVVVGIADPEVAVYAYVQEFGSPAQNIPAQPYFFSGIESAAEDIVSELGEGAVAVLDGDTDSIDETLNTVGELTVESIREITPVDTGRLRDSIDFQVRSK